MSKMIETVIIGGGQAGLALSYYLTQEGREHIVLEQAAKPANAWRNDRWDSFTLVTPNWSVRMPGAEYQGGAPHGFMSREEVVAYLEDYVARFKLPIKFEVCVDEVVAGSNDKGFIVKTDNGQFEASNVVVATGLFQKPKIPIFSDKIASYVDQIHSGKYRNPGALKPGAVLVVGSGQSGCQIAEELYKSGREVYLCVGQAGRAPRSYRGKDISQWISETGFDSRTVDDLTSPQAKFTPNPHVSGANGGHTLNLHQFARDGVTLLGHLQDASGERIELRPDLKENLAKADKFEAEILQMIDKYIEQAGLDVPEEEFPQIQDGYVVDELQELDLRSAGITTIIWATGYTFDFSMVQLPIFDGDGFPIQKRGVTEVPGLYFIGLPWLHTQRSGLLAGVGEDAEHLVEVITEN